jgi:hypothetical protein
MAYKTVGGTGSRRLPVVLQQGTFLAVLAVAANAASVTRWGGGQVFRKGVSTRAHMHSTAFIGVEGLLVAESPAGKHNTQCRQRVGAAKTHLLAMPVMSSARRSPLRLRGGSFLDKVSCSHVSTRHTLK